MNRRIWAALLAVALLVTMLPAPAAAEESKKTQTVFSQTQLASYVNSVVAPAAAAQGPAAQATAGGGGFLSTPKGKLTVGLLVVAAVVVTAFAFKGGVTPRQWP